MIKAKIHKHHTGIFPWALALLPAGAVLAAFILPYGASLFGGFHIGRLGAGPDRETILPFSLLLPITFFTVKQAVLSTLAALVLGLPGAVLLGGSGRGTGTGILRSLSGISFTMPSILVVLAFVLFFGNSGWVNRFFSALSGGREGPLKILYRSEAIILAHAFYNFPLVIRLVGDGIAQARGAYGPAAASLGSSPFKTALTVLFPVVLPSILAASFLIFLYCFTSFAVVLVLGGGPASTTIAVEIYRYARISLNYSAAGFLALIETGIALTAFLAYLYFERKARIIPISIGERYAGDRNRKKRNYSLFTRLCAVLYGVGLCFFILGPILSIPIESFLYKPSRASPPLLSLRWWLGLGERCIPALFRSLFLAFISASLSCILAILAAAAVWSAEGVSGKKTFPASILRFCAAAPLASSGIVLGLGYLILYGRDQSRSVWAAAALHAVTSLPFAFNSISEGLKALPAHTSASASVFGASPLVRLLTVALPLSASRIRSAWGFSAMISLGELNAVMMLGLENWETLPLLIYRAAGSYRYGTACAAGTLLILCCVLMLLISDARFSLTSLPPPGKKRKNCGS
ncbi:MAG: iron ABC transporter permease [Treponema sp.]|jgi:thiamine transport system permease protein|nr:iron ABC transporter permease [Treponema sp.]